MGLALDLVAFILSRHLRLVQSRKMLDPDPSLKSTSRPNGQSSRLVVDTNDAKSFNNPKNMFKAAQVSVIDNRCSTWVRIQNQIKTGLC